MSREPGQQKSRDNKDGTHVDRIESKTRTTGIIPALLLLLWVEGILAAYFWVHKPWPSGQNAAPFMAILDLLLACTLVALAGGLGRLIFGERLPFSPAENTALQMGIGMGILSIVVLAAGLFGFIGVWQAWAALGLGVLLLCKPISDWLVGWRNVFRSDPPSSAVEKASRWLVLFLVAIAALQALAPPLAWDSLVYHLQLPRLYLQMGRIEHISDFFFAGFPQLAEMMFTWAMALRTGTTAATLGWVVGVIAAFGAGGFAGRLVGKEYRWIAPAILLSGSSISRGLSWAYIDLWVLFFSLAAIIMLDQHGRTKEIAWVSYAAVFTGLAFSTKYTAGMMIPVGMIYLFVVYLQGRQLTRPTKIQIPSGEGLLSRIKHPYSQSWNFLYKPILLFVCISLLIVSPWFVKNIITTGNPLDPFFFDGRGTNELHFIFYQYDLYERTLLDHLLLPFESTIFGIQGGPIFNTSISPLFLALIPGVILGWGSLQEENRKSIVRLATISVAVWFFWGLASHISPALTISRHYYLIFPALVILASFGLECIGRIELRSIQIGWVVRFLVMFVIVLTMISEVLNFAKTDPIRILAGIQTPEEYLDEELGWFEPAMQTVNSLPEGSKVAMFWEPRSYYCEIPCSPDVILDRWWYLMRTAGGADEAVSQLRSQNYTHVLVYDLGVQLVLEAANFLEPEDWEELEDFRDDELDFVQVIGGVYTLYEIPPAVDE